MQVLIAAHVDAHGVGSGGVFTHGPQPQPGAGVLQIPPHHQGDDHTQVHQDVVVKEHLAQHRDVGQARDRQVGKAVLDVGVVVHGGPAHRLHAVAHEEEHAQAEGGDGQTGDVLVGLEGDGEHGEDEAAQGGGEEGHQHAHHHGVGVAAQDIAEDGAHGHGALHAQVQAARLLNGDLSHGAVEQGDVIHNDVVEECGDNVQLIIHGAPPPFWR